MTILKPGGVFIATPTHICKRYCSAEFCKAAIENAVDPFGSKFHVYCNSRASAALYYGDMKIMYRDIEPIEGFYEQPDSVHKRLVTTVRKLREDFLLTDCDWYLSLEADVILGPGMLMAMLHHNVDVLHTNCYPGFHTEPEFCETDRITMGCTLVKRHVIEKIPFRYDKGLLAAHYDAFFVNDCRAAGFGVYYDPQIEPDHREDRLPGRGWNNIPASER